jgi:acyl-CoA synthetase (NDP forming)
MTTPDAVVDALFRQAGVSRVETLEQMFDVARAFAHQPLPAGPRVAIVGNAGGPAILAADAAEAAGLDVCAQVDIEDAGTPEVLERALTRLLDDEAVDAVIAIYVPPLPGRDQEMIAAIGRASAGCPRKPVLANVLGGPAVIDHAGRGVPVYRFPESAALALARMVELAAWRGRRAGSPPSTDGLDEPAVRAVVDGFLAQHPDGGRLPASEARELLARAGIPIAAEEAGRPAGVELVAGVTLDESFGPLVLLGAGGPLAEVLGDRAVHLCPLDDVDAAQMVRSLRSAPLLLGRHGHDAVDIAALEALVVRLGQLVEVAPEVVALDADPVVAGPSGVVVVGVDVHLEPDVAHPERALRRLR